MFKPILILICISAFFGYSLIIYNKGVNVGIMNQKAIYNDTTNQEMQQQIKSFNDQIVFINQLNKELESRNQELVKAKPVCEGTINHEFFNQLLEVSK